MLFLFRIPSCINVDREFIDGEDISKTNPYKYYKICLNSMLVVPDSMVSGDGPLLPPRENLNLKVYQDTLVDGTIEIRVITSEGLTIYFRNLMDPEGFKELISYKFRAYDSENGISYFLEKRDDGYYRFFGIKMENGNQFNVYVNDLRSRFEKMYSWKFSPDGNYLLKAGDLDNDIYGWSLVNLKNGQEGIARFERYEEFVTNIKWSGTDKFSYVLTKIPFKEGYKYTKDYKFYYSLVDGNPFPGVELKGDYMYPVTYVLDVKGHLISERLTEVKI